MPGLRLRPPVALLTASLILSVKSFTGLAPPVEPDAEVGGPPLVQTGQQRGLPLPAVVLTFCVLTAEFVSDAGTSVETNGSLPASPSGLVTRLVGSDRSSPAVVTPGVHTFRY